MEEAVRRELAARRGECYVALGESEPELMEALGERARVVRPVDREGPGRVALDVPGAVVSGDRAYLENQLVVDGESVEPGMYGRTAVLEPLKSTLERLWRTAIPQEDISSETWEARRDAAAAYAEYRFGERGSGGLRAEFSEGYGEQAPDLSRIEEEFWSHIDARGLAALVDDIDPVALRTGLGDLVPGPRGVPLPEPSEELVDGLRCVDSSVLREGIEVAGGLSTKLVGDSYAEGLVLVVSSLLVPRPRRDVLFAAGADTVAEARG